MHPTLHTLAIRLIAFGVLGAVCLTLYRAAACRIDVELIPARARPRVRRLAAQACKLLGASCVMALVGLALLAAD